MGLSSDSAVDLLEIGAWITDGIPSTFRKKKLELKAPSAVASAESQEDQPNSHTNEPSKKPTPMVPSRGLPEHLPEIKLGEHNHARGKRPTTRRKYTGFPPGCENKAGSYGKGNWNGRSNRQSLSPRRYSCYSRGNTPGKASASESSRCGV